MTEVLRITDTELEAIRSVERYIATSIPRGESFSPSQPIQEDIEAVNCMLSRLAPYPPAEEVASRPNGEHPLGQADPIGIVRDHPSHGPHRSTPGQGEQCFIYNLGRADRFEDSVTPGYGQISAGHGPSLNEDFADTIWPVIVKVKPAVTKCDLIQHLRDLADGIEQHGIQEKTMIEIKLTETNVFTRWPCTVCGGCTEKVSVLAESEGASVRVCETCLQRSNIDETLEAHARASEARAANLRSLKGQLKVPSYEEWQAKEAEVEARAEMEWRTRDPEGYAKYIAEIKAAQSAPSNTETDPIPF